MAEEAEQVHHLRNLLLLVILEGLLLDQKGLVRYLLHYYQCYYCLFFIKTRYSSEPVQSLFNFNFFSWLGRQKLNKIAIRLLFLMSISLRRLPTIGVSASKVEMSSNTSSKGFCLLKIFLLIGSNFCLKLASFILSLVT